MLFFVRLYAGDPSRLPSALIGRNAPLTSLPPLEGLLRGGLAVPGYLPNELKGKVVVLNVFASWCGPCRDEHPLLMQLAATAPFSAGHAILAGLNHKDEPENARRFLGTHGNPYGVVGTDRNGRSSIDWGVYGVPETFVVDRNGKIAMKHVGPLNEKSLVDLNAAIQLALK